MRQCHLSTLILAVRISMNLDPGQNIIKDSKKNSMDVSKNGCFFSMDASLASDLGNFQCM